MFTITGDSYRLQKLPSTSQKTPIERRTTSLKPLTQGGMLLYLQIGFEGGEPVVVSGGELVVVVEASFESGDARGVAVESCSGLSEGDVGVLA